MVTMDEYHVVTVASVSVREYVTRAVAISITIATRRLRYIVRCAYQRDFRHQSYVQYWELIGAIDPTIII